MPELPEVETVRRMLAESLPGRHIVRAEVSRHRLRTTPLTGLAAQLVGHVFALPRRTGKFLFLDFEAGVTLLSHLGMSGRWLFWPEGTASDDSMPHVHLRLTFADGARLWYQDIRRFGMLRVVPLDALERDPSVRLLGPDPLLARPDGATLRAMAKGSRVAIKTFLLDQRKLAGVGNIYASEILFRARVDPRRRAGALTLPEWEAVAAQMLRVLEAAVERMGTTFSTFRTIWNEPGGYGDQLLVYGRQGEPCHHCAAALRRFVQGGRATFWCPTCQRGSAKARQRTR
ncbi:MAG: bifunctional DNA-formamidopyrimidine glycosylase/DNA-(apurinic or apyrimidinic site) lyase [Candidatus Eisenbacteria bacterium]